MRRLREAMEGDGDGPGGAARVELLSKKKNGESVWLATHAVPVRDAAGKLLRVVAVSYDITSRKSEAAAAAAAATAAAAAEGGGGGGVHPGAHHFQTVFGGAVCGAGLGAGASKGAVDLGAGRATSLSSSVEDGNGHGPSLGHDGEDGGTLSSAEIRLRASRRSLVDVISAVGITDPGTAGNPLTAVSEGFERLFGFAASEVRGSSPLSLCATDQGRAALARVVRVVRRAGFASELMRVHDKEGAPLSCLMYVAPMGDRGTLASGGTPEPPADVDDDASLGVVPGDDRDRDDVGGGDGDGDGDRVGDRDRNGGSNGSDGSGGGTSGGIVRGRQQQPSSGCTREASSATPSGPAYVYVYIDVTLRRPWRVGHYQLGEVLGKGSFGEVRIARDREKVKEGGPGFGTGSSAGGPGPCVAVKIIDTSKFRSVDDIALIQDETQILAELKHINVIQLNEVFLHHSLFVFVMELAHGGTLLSLIHKEGRPPGPAPVTEEEKNKCRSLLDEERARDLFRQILAAVEFCHRRRVVHRDLKPENILLDDEGTIKVADFGLSTIVKPFDAGAGVHCGTPAFMAPELFTEGKVEDTGAAVDVWSMGVILYEMVMGNLPFARQRPRSAAKDAAGHAAGKADTGKTLDQVICQGRVHYPPWMSDRLVDLLRGMFEVSVSQRLTVHEIKRHGWVTAEEEDDLMLGSSADENSDGAAGSEDGGAAHAPLQRTDSHMTNDSVESKDSEGDEGGGDWGIPVAADSVLSSPLPSPPLRSPLVPPLSESRERGDILRGRRAGNVGGRDRDTDGHANAHAVSSHDHMAAHYHNLALLDEKPKYGPGNAAARKERKKRDFLSQLLGRVEAANASGAIGAGGVGGAGTGHVGSTSRGAGGGGNLAARVQHAR